MEMRPAAGGRDLVAAKRDATRQALRTCGLPIVVLPEVMSPFPGRLAGYESSDDTVTTVEIIYGGRQHGGPWIVVSTSRWTGTRMSAGPLRTLLERHMRQQGSRFSAVAWGEDDTTVAVDGQPVVGQLMRAGHRWWAVRCQHGDIEITVVARDWVASSVALETLLDIEPLLSTLDMEASPPSRQNHAEEAAELVPQLVSRDPHRALVDAYLHNSQQMAEWQADGGPQPSFPPQMDAVWRAAVARHAWLTDQSTQEANRAVAGIVGQLCNLHHNAAWFRENAWLRERATSETLLFGTGLSVKVPSLRAQQAWEQQYGTPPPAGHEQVVGRATAFQTWIGEWASWARAQEAS